VPNFPDNSTRNATTSMHLSSRLGNPYIDLYFPWGSQIDLATTKKSSGCCENSTQTTKILILKQQPQNPSEKFRFMTSGLQQQAA